MSAELAALVRDHPGPIRPAGSGSRPWRALTGEPISTAGLDRIVEYNPGDFTAVLEAGVSLATAQAAFAEHGQWLAVDPPGGGTIGGLVATADSGPARQRYGGVRDLVIGVTVVLSDGTVARSGGKVIKNVAGYDLGKLFTGSFGSLGFLSSVTVRLHPAPTGTVTVVAETDDPAWLHAAVRDLARRPLEPLSLDVAWDGHSGRLLVRFAGVAAPAQAELVSGLLKTATVETDDGPLWERQRAGQRSADGTVVKVSGRRSDLPLVIAAAQACGATVVSRAGLGLSWLAVPSTEPEVIAELRRSLAPRATVVLDGAARLPVEPVDAGGIGYRIKERFDPDRKLAGGP